jgi:hypothetical protein
LKEIFGEKKSSLLLQLKDAAADAAKANFFFFNSLDCFKKYLNHFENQNDKY